MARMKRRVATTPPTPPTPTSLFTEAEFQELLTLPEWEESRELALLLVLDDELWAKTKPLILRRMLVRLEGEVLCEESTAIQRAIDVFFVTNGLVTSPA
ncbi:MAG: hypothetical protein K2R93_10955 [Gemmatimonadaceae bacterium]|nr:hypothetical protein [Gemmatimonadaceae bacterium]